MPKSAMMAQALDHLRAYWRMGKSLKEVAQLYRVDAGNLERAFRQSEGLTVKHYLDRKRQVYVRARLADTTVLGYQIGHELGFENPLAFYRWVKRAFGVSFSELRKRDMKVKSDSDTTISGWR